MRVAASVSIAAAVVMTTIGTANALTATFNLTGSDSTNPALLPYDFSVSNGGLDLTVSGHSLRNGSINGSNILTGGTVRDEKIGRYFGGVGVSTSNDDDHQVDGRSSPGGNNREVDEFVQFAFNQPIKILGVDFSFVGGNDDFRWLIDTNNNGSLGIGDFLSPETDIPNSTIFNLFGNTTTNVFGIGAFRSNDEWKLKSIKVDYEVAPVPLPAALPLFMGALSLLGFLGWRRKQSATA